MAPKLFIFGRLNVLASPRGEENISALCFREDIAERLYYNWSNAFLERNKRHLSGDTARQATSHEAKELQLAVIFAGMVLLFFLLIWVLLTFIIIIIEWVML